MRHTQLRSFHAVAQRLSFTAAARELGVSQPTITTQVKSLEQEFGVELFVRRGRRIELTETGGGLLDPPATVPVVVAGYLPQFSDERQQWYVDVAFDARATFWPFVRLAVARYQPESVTGAHLSTPVRLDQVQLAPERTASVARTDSTHARVVVSGLAGHRESASRQYAVSVSRNRTLVARLQRYDATLGGDLAWTSVDAVELAPVRVNVVSPGTIDSDLWHGRPAPLREAAFASYAGLSLLGRVGTVDEVVEAVMFLLGNGFMTGSTLFSDGGFALR